MSKFLLFILLIYLLTCPFYIFQSGTPQPADMIIALGGVVFLFSKEFRLVLNNSIVKYLYRFVLLVIVINIIYYFYFSSIGINNNMFIPPIFYLFNFIFYLIFFFVLGDNDNDNDNDNNNNINLISIVIILSLLIQVILAVLNINGGIVDNTHRRAIIFFNNPNQLGYFALLMLTLFTILPSKLRQNIFAILFTVTLTAILIFYSGSRAAMIGVIFLGIILLFQIGKKYVLSFFGIILIGLFFFPLLIQTTFIQERINLLETRNNRFTFTNISEAQIRGYDRLWLHPEYLFFGAGEGEFDRFDSYHNLEIHSGFGTVIFSYGILGFIIFIYFLYKTIEFNKAYNFILLMPILIYNISHQGLRTSLFWGLLAAIYIISLNEYKMNLFYKKK